MASVAILLLAVFGCSEVASYVPLQRGDQSELNARRANQIHIVINYPNYNRDNNYFPFVQHGDRIRGALWAAAAAGGCQSCGSECAAACGTRRFRACCFNYLRRKRGPAVPPAQLKLWLAKNQDPDVTRPDKRLPIFVENLPESAPARLYDLEQLAEDPSESHLQLIYDV